MTNQERNRKKLIEEVQPFINSLLQNYLPIQNCNRTPYDRIVSDYTAYLVCQLIGKFSPKKIENMWKEIKNTIHENLNYIIAESLLEPEFNNFRKTSEMLRKIMNDENE